MRTFLIAACLIWLCILFPPLILILIIWALME